MRVLNSQERDFENRKRSYDRTMTDDERIAAIRERLSLVAQYEQEFANQGFGMDGDLPERADDTETLLQLDHVIGVAEAIQRLRTTRRENVHIIA
jgi:hypothetical protein